MGSIFVRQVTAFAVLATGITVSAQTVVLDDFDSGVVSAKMPTSGGDGLTWYDSIVKDKSQPSASDSTFPGAMQITENEPLNGVYRRFEGVVPSSGSYHVNCEIKVVEAEGYLDVIQNYQVGVIINGSHRDTGNTTLAPATIYAETAQGYLTAGDDSAKPVQSLRTPNFNVNAGDNILISLGTDVTSGNFNQNSGIWGPSTILVDNVVLEPAELPVSLSGFSLE